MVKFGDRSRCHAPSRGGARDNGGTWRRLRNLMQDIFAPAGSLGFGDPGGVSTCLSKGCWKISSENFSRDGFFQ